MEIVPSPRKDYCTQCGEEHGYDCPKDVGLFEGDICNRKGCEGKMEKVETDYSCSCHINPPCSSCTDAEYECQKCGFLLESEA